MIGRIAIVLLCLGLAIAPAAVSAESGGEGSCVWTDRGNGRIEAGVNPDECTSAGGQWEPDSTNV